MRQSQDALEAIERRRTILRTILFLIILGTIPFYLLGFWLWGTAPDTTVDRTQTPEVTFTRTPLGADATDTEEVPTNTPRPTSTPIGPLNPTPIQFTPPTVFVPPPTVFIPSPTTPPTFTPLPPLPTNTPIPTATEEDTSGLPPPILTLSAEPIQLNPPTATPLIPPSDTPAP